MNRSRTSKSMYIERAKPHEQKAAERWYKKGLSMTYIVFDLEWNQCPDGKARENPALPFEILEIGAIKLNERRQELSRFHALIRPQVYLRLHPCTREILHMSREQLQAAAPFPSVLEEFFQWCGTEPSFCTWGSSDLTELQRNMRYYGIPSPFPFPLYYYDIQKLFSICFEDGKSRRTLEHAVDVLQLDKTVSFHEALSDAHYTAEILRLLSEEQLRRYFSIDYFRSPASRAEELCIDFGSYQKFVSRRFPTKDDAMRDRKVQSMPCFLCGRPARRKIPWFASGGKNYCCLAYCDTHGYLKGKIRIKKAEEGGFFCVKTIRQIDDDRAKDLQARRLTLQERRKEKRLRH